MRLLAQLRAILNAYQRRPSTRNKRAALPLSSVWPLWLIVGFLVTLCVAAGWYSWAARPRTPLRVDVQDVALPAGKDLSIGVNQLELGHVYLFHYPEAPDGRNRFIVERRLDGSVAVARATCRTCMSNARDHYLSDVGLVCGNCNQPMRMPTVKDKTAEPIGCD